MKSGENFTQRTRFRLEEGLDNSACRVSFVLVLQVKISVIQSLRRVDSGSASLKFCSHLKTTIWYQIVVETKKTHSSDNEHILF